MAKDCEACGRPLPQRYSNKTMERIRYCSRRCSKDAIHRPPEERFDEKTTGEPNTGCILWTGATSSVKGYGSFGLNGKIVRSHVYAYERAYGPVPKGKVVAHKCDVTLCVNPAHLFAATQAENLADAKAKGRTAKGERQGCSKLTEADVIAIRAWAGRCVDAARRFGVSPVTITNIKHRRIWKHVA